MHVNVCNAKAGMVDKGRMRTEVLGGWYVWQDEERSCEDGACLGTGMEEGREREQVVREGAEGKGGRGSRRGVSGVGRKRYLRTLRSCSMPFNSCEHARQRHGHETIPRACEEGKGGGRQGHPDANEWEWSRILSPMLLSRPVWRGEGLPVSRD